MESESFAFGNEAPLKQEIVYKDDIKLFECQTIQW